MLNLNFQNGQAPALNARNMNAIVESINTLGYAVGGPNVASTVSAMTDTSKVYVYTGSETGYTTGNWYYYNGSAWVSGGVYQATAVETDTTLTMPGEPADAKATGDAVTELKSALTLIDNQFDDVNVILNLTEFESGYINNSGELVTSGIGSYKYASVQIDETLVGKTIYISGSAWYTVRPYVFVGTTVASPSLPNPGGTVTQYTDLLFTPSETGVLYINRYGSNIGSAYIKSIGALKSSALPDDLSSAVFEYAEATNIPLMMTSGKLVSASNGAITDASNQNWRVSDYINIDGATKIKVTTEMFYGYGLVVFYDANKGYVSGIAAAAGGTVTQIYLQEIEVPQNAIYVVIGYLYQLSMPNPYLYVFNKRTSALPSKRWDNKKWVCVGDSLTANNDRTSYHYFDYVRDYTGISVVNMGVSGTGYANGQNGNNAFYQRILDIDTDADVVTIFGSFNDLSTGLELGSYSDTETTTIAGCINKTIDNLLSVIPLANVAIVAPTPWNNVHPGIDSASKNYVDLLGTIAKYRSIPFLNLWEISGLRPWDSNFRAAAYSADDGNGVHPNHIGHKIIASKFMELLNALLL